MRNILKTALFTLLFLGCALGATIQGDRVSDGEVPWIVSMHYSFDSWSGSAYCSGVIISERHVLTVASCCHRFGGCETPTSMSVKAGSILSSGIGGSQHQVVSITNHENFDINTYANDISIWEIYPPFEFNKQCYPIALPIEQYNLADDYSLSVAGFGIDPTEPGQYGGYGSPIQRTQVSTISLLLCKSLFGTGAENVSVDSLCAGSPNRNCYDDLGGPLYHNGVLYGLIKEQPNGVSCENTQPQSQPGVHTRVSYHVEWIRNKVGGLHTPFNRRFLFQ